jgi:hypothetical protein
LTTWFRAVGPALLASADRSFTVVYENVPTQAKDAVFLGVCRMKRNPCIEDQSPDILIRLEPANVEPSA